MPPLKRCTKCGEEKPATSDFWHAQKGGRYGFTSKCKECKRQINTAWRQANPEKMRAASKRHRTNNREQLLKRRREWYAANAATVRERKRELRRRSPEKARAHCRKWRRENPEKARASWKRSNERRKKPLPEHKTCVGCRRKLPLADFQRYDSKGIRRKVCNACHLQRIRDWAATNPKRVRRAKRKYATNHPEVRRVLNQKRRARKNKAAGDFTKTDLSAKLELQGWRCYYCDAELADGFHVEHKIPLVRGGTNWPANIAVACPGCNWSKGTKTATEFAAAKKR